jgi:hypothetical protein
MAETLTDPMAGYDPNRAMQPQPPAPAQSAGYEFDPRKDIDPMANRFFADTNADRNLTPEFRNRIQAQYLQGMSDIQAQREKIEGERLRNILNRQSIEENQLALTEARRKQEDAMRAAQRQMTVADTLKGIRDSNLPPEEKQRQFNEAKISLAGDYVTNPTVKTIFDTVESEIPKPVKPFEVSDATKTSLIIDDGLPEWLVNSGDTELIQKAKSYADSVKKDRSENEKEVEEARKMRTSLVTDFAKFEPEMMSEDDRINAGVSASDNNAYLTPSSQNKGRMIVQLVYGADGIAEYEALPDSERIKMIYRAQRDLVVGNAVERGTPVKEKVTDNTVDSLLFGKQKR